MSSTMPKWLKAIVIVVAIAAGVTFLYVQQNANASLLRLDGHSYHFTVMRTDTELQKGLSGTNSLPADQAMLFAFPSTQKWRIWMKDMKYPIDIVWLNSDREVIYTKKDAQPSSYPSAFTPDSPASYVIELPSGTIDKTGIKNGDPAGLPSGI